jgi:hypothetical protein
MGVAYNRSMELKRCTRCGAEMPATLWPPQARTAANLVLSALQESRIRGAPSRAKRSDRGSR